METPQFKHVHQLRVRSYEVDWQGIVHNSNYLRYFEVGRIEYFRHLGSAIDMKSIQGESKIVLVRHEIDYEAPARYDDVLNIKSRVSFIRNSSFAMEGIIERALTGQVLSRTTAYHVWLDPGTDRPRTISEEFRRLVQSFEGSDCQIEWPTTDV